MSSSIRRGRTTGALVCAGFLAASGPAQAVDGVREINQTCAVNTGCFSGDAAGFPVEITERGSYALTSNLEVPDANTTAISVTASPGTTIDLNGFVIFGPGGSGTGAGIVNAGALTTVRNGTIRNVGGRGIDLGSRSLVESVTLSSVGSDGVRLGDSSLLLDSIVHDSGDAGLEIGSGQVGYARNMFQVNANGSIEEPVGLAVEMGGNYCDDGLCSTDGRRRFYLTTDSHVGSAALSACDPGFHMASLFEVHDVTGLRYDTSRGATKADSGSGPPSNTVITLSAGGWIRTGGPSESQQTLAGVANCSAYTTSGGYGTLAWLTGDWSQAPDIVGPWEAAPDDCVKSRPVWCIQN